MKILVVDDDKMIRNWLSMLIRQITHPDLEIHTVNDASSALEFCRSNEVNLVITDITMPRQSGLELLAELRRLYPDTEVAVLSAYDNYEYIRQALQLGAIDYILKAEMTLSDIASLLQKVRIFSNYGHGSAPNTHPFYQYNNTLTEFLEGDLDTAAFLARFDPPLPPENLAAEFFILQENQDSYAAPEQILDLCSRTLAAENLIGYPFQVDPFYFVLYSLPMEAYEYRQEMQQKVLLLLERNSSNYLHKRFRYSHSVFFPDAGLLHDSLTEHSLKIQSLVYYNDSCDTFCHLDSGLLSNTIYKLRSQLEMRRYEEALSSLTDFISLCHHHRTYLCDLKSAILYCIALFLENTSNLESSSTFSAGCHRITKKINLASSSEKMQAYLQEFSELYRRSILDMSGKTAVSPAVQKAASYILENYRNHITLEDLASHIYLNKTYISQLFKRDLNTSFGSYLEGVRITKAQELLRSSSLSVTQIAEEVGYTSQSYFTKVFKKKLGIGPLKYRSMTAPSLPSPERISFSETQSKE